MEDALHFKMESFIDQYLLKYIDYVKMIDRQNPNEDGAGELFQKAWNDFHIIGGHYVLLNKSPYNLEVELFINPDLEPESHNNQFYSKTARQFDRIKYNFGFAQDHYSTEQKGILIDAIFESNRQKQFSSALPSQIPKYYQNLPPYSSIFSIHQLSYSHQLIANENVEYMFCLSDEILFFNYAWRYLFRLAQVYGPDSPLQERNANTQFTSNPWDVFKNCKNELLPEVQLIQFIDADANKNIGLSLFDLLKDLDALLIPISDATELDRYFIAEDWEKLGLLKMKSLKNYGTQAVNLTQLVKYMSYISSEHTSKKDNYFPFESWRQLYGNREKPYFAKLPSDESKKIELHRWMATIIVSFINNSFTRWQKAGKLKYIFTGLENTQSLKEISIGQALHLIHTISRSSILPNFYFTAIHRDKIVPDQFVFPLVSSDTESGFFNDKYRLYTSSDSSTSLMKINKPLLIAAYIKPVSEISGEYLDEDRNSLVGFKITQLMCQRVAAKLIDNIFYGSIVKHRMLSETVKTAKAAIMGRNMSHNIGSHVLSYIQAKLHNVNDILKNDVLYNIVTFNNGRYEIAGEQLNIAIKSIDTIEIPFLIGLGKFINYLQERQDFIATISTDSVPEISPVNFKDFVLDFFAWDDKMIRHQGEEGSKAENMLLNYIALSEGVTRTSNQGKYGLRIIVNNLELDKPYSPDDAFRNLEVGIPAGIMGRQAIFSIFENFIRNSAKHGISEAVEPEINPDGTIKGSNDLIVDIRIGDTDEAIFKDFTFFDPFNDTTLQDDLYQKFSSDYIRVVLSDRYANYTKAEQHIKRKLKSEFVDSNTLFMVEEAKGLKEMRISAAWLRQLSVIDEVQELPVLSFGFHQSQDIPGDERDIAYQFFLKRTFYGVIVLADEEINELEEGSGQKIIISDCNKHGWKVIRFSDFKAINVLDKLSFKILILDQKLEAQLRAYDGLRIPLRKVYFSPHEVGYKSFGEILSILSRGGESSQKLFIYFYQKHIHSFLNIDMKALTEQRFQVGISDKIAQDVVLNKIHYLTAEKDTDILATKVALECNLIFKAHLSRGEDKEEFIRNYCQVDLSFKPEFQHILYLESITGGNSTNRIFRNEVKDELWYLKVLESAFTRILIIDERIWGDFASAGSIVSSLELKRLIEGAESSNTIKKSELLKNIISRAIAKKIDKHFSDKRYLFQYLNQLFSTIFFEIKKKTFWYNQRLIHFGNFDGSNLFTDMDESSGTFEKGKIELELTGRVASCTFHFVSIHQGLIDKLFHLCDAGNNEAEIRTKVILALQKAFGKKTVLFIHSGRSKPDKTQLPVEIPFISYSVIKNLMDDAKLSFTDRFYSSIIETEN